MPLRECMEQLGGSKGTIVIADYADNPGSGSYGDCTTLISALLHSKAKNAAVGALWDPEAVKEIKAHGEGAVVTVSIGGKTDPLVGGGPFM